ncbi:MAG TPA: hypothetical protein VFA28_10370 [Bryobacteraceae bacterium]|jgi:predicted PurR-regulated permease PerM|nr:hypothetical protein [Bryobacteraceae bacterium]
MTEPAPTAANIFTEGGDSMRRRRIGQLVPTAALGLGTMIGLWLLGTPLATPLPSAVTVPVKLLNLHEEPEH